MSELYNKSIDKLELNKVLELLAQCANSSDGKAACLKLKPVSDLQDVNRLLNETSAAVGISFTHGYPAFFGLQDVSDSLERAHMGGSLLTKELLSVAGVLKCARNVRGFLPEDENENILAPFFAMVIPNKYLEESIFNAIISEDEIADSASSELADIRRHMRVQSARIKDTLQNTISSPVYSKFLREPIITIRQGRYVVPVKSEFKNEIPGLVHDVSATGSTYFIEPMTAVSANNALRDLELQEKKEIERILSELSAQVADHADDIRSSISALTKLDVIFAKARLASKMKAWPPTMNDSGIISLRNARHPLIDEKTVVPISMRLGDDFDTMIITGPNTGGKTVSLKTVGLLTLMAECGLHIPAGDGTNLSTFDSILADIGDEQSIAQSLSTFSSHMRTIVDIVAQCGTRTMILFDELGAGTDPAEGAALAISLIEFCRKMGSCVVATTHYAELKLYAMQTGGVINASCEFDVDTLQPTYRLLIGVPGKSNAFAISKRLGLSESILKDAAGRMEKSDKDFEDVLQQLDNQRKQMELARCEAEMLRAETEKIKIQSEEYSNQIMKERDRMLENARSEAKRIIDEARIAANAATDEIKALKKQLTDNADLHGINSRQSELRRSLNEAEKKLQSGNPTVERPKPTRDIIVGDTVELIKLGTKAAVLAINSDGTLQLQAGILKISAKVNEVYLLENSNSAAKAKMRPLHSGREMKMSALSQEVDLRGMDSIEAIGVLERYLDEAFRDNLQSVRIIHGKGTGVLRGVVHQSLRKNKHVKSFRLGVYGEGEDGVTIVEFR